MADLGTGPRTIHLHIGTHKTGTTYLQTVLDESREPLARHGFHYLTLGANHSLLYLLFCEHPEREHDMLKRGLGDTARARRWVSARLADLGAELAGTPARNVLISGEELCRLSSAGVERMRRFLAPHADRFRILCYVRDPFEFCVSDAQEALKGGLTLDEVARHPPICAYRSYLEKYLRIFGVDSVTVRPFERKRFPGDRLLGDFLGWIGLPDILAEGERRVARPNSSICHEAALILGYLNGRYPPFLDGAVNPARALIAPGWLARIEGRPFGLPASALARLVGANAADLAWLRDLVAADWFPMDGPLPTELIQEETQISPTLASLAELIHEIARLSGEAMNEALVARAMASIRSGNGAAALRHARDALAVRPSHAPTQRLLEGLSESRS